MSKITNEESKIGDIDVKVDTIQIPAGKLSYSLLKLIY